MTVGKLGPGCTPVQWLYLFREPAIIAGNGPHPNVSISSH